MKIYKRILFANFMAFLTITLLFISLAIQKETKYKQVEWQKELPIEAYVSDVWWNGVITTHIRVYITNPYLPYPQDAYDNETHYCYQVKIYAKNTVIESVNKSRFVVAETRINGTKYVGRVVDLHTNYTEIKQYDYRFEKEFLSQFSAIGFYRGDEPYYADVFRYDVLGQGLLYSVIAIAVIWLSAFLYFQIKGFKNWLRAE